MKKSILLLLLLLTIGVQGQDAVTLLKFEEAEKAFNSGDFKTVLEKLDEVEAMAQPTSKTLYLRIASLNHLFDGDKLFNNPEQYELLEGLRDYVNTYLEAMGNYELDDRFREVYQIGEDLKNYPENRAAWEKWNQEEDNRRNPKEYYPSGALKSITKTKEGSKTVAWQAYYENGQLKEEGEKDGEKKIGPWKHYHENGQLAAQGTYWDGGKITGKIGKWYYYYDNGKTKEIAHYKSVSYTSGRVRSHLWGPYRSWYENGQLREQGTYKEEVTLLLGTGYNEDNNKKTGVWKEYYENGQLKLKEGHGDQYVYEAYYKSGQLKAIKEYVKVNRKILLRELRTYYEDGDLKSTKKYSLLSDSNKASWEAYHSNGQLKEEGKYKYGDKHGKWSYYDQNGNLIKEERL
ncbi:MORN variant repeat-containing protein [Allomuricauda ruestringensis DSM 13258]|uniref:MORN variant repeat-containing protein n=1 Tax=Allomuricauda ruestringensis (strain DSM 13258 / CIP 107369 / LMG 19739 / B1) TaxID=886377 RepID=G2PIM6_ALLRU|nr:MORN repeat-containing protein [Allomuricauda ruestringensis]AEM70740.1 MORN variant repeat-containing protein [Allomuricauda ruestringensis DSM 13258]